MTAPGGGEVQDIILDGAPPGGAVNGRGMQDLPNFGPGDELSASLPALPPPGLSHPSGLAVKESLSSGVLVSQARSLSTLLVENPIKSRDGDSNPGDSYPSTD